MGVRNVHFHVHAWDPRESTEKILMLREMAPSPLYISCRGVPLFLQLSDDSLYDILPLWRTQNITYQAEQRDVKPVEDYHHDTLFVYRIYD